MKRKFKLNNLDCANCAAKMEAAIAKLDGVMNVSVNFMTQSLTLEAKDDLFNNIMDETVKICKKIEPDCVIVR
jgi:Cation transport ATPase